jgi:hypothetical protein
VAEGAYELEVLSLCFGAFPNPTDLAILAAGRTICDPPGEIGNVSVDWYCHASIIQPWALIPGGPFTLNHGDSKGGACKFELLASQHEVDFARGTISKKTGN